MRAGKNPEPVHAHCNTILNPLCNFGLYYEDDDNDDDKCNLS